MSIQLPYKALTNFISLYKKEFNIDLSEQEALKELIDLLYICAFTEGKHHLLTSITSLQIKNRD